MTTSLDRPIRKFNPGLLQSDSELIEQFVVRQGELDIVLEVLRGNIDSSSCQHVLLVAPRGQGKTMLLARVTAELRTDENLSMHLFPVRFMEESLEVFTLADFWLEALLHLARETETSCPELSRELCRTRDDLTDRYNETLLEDRAFAAVVDASDRLDKQLVLMVENLQALSQIVDEDFGWKLRKVLQCEPQIMLLGTATSRFAALDDARQPFFEFFHMVSLEPLGTMACRRLWEMVSGQSVGEREVRPLEILTGGNPRLLVIVATFAGHRSFHQLMEDLVALIDEHTEYFRGHLEVFAKTERRVYLAVIDLWQPSTAAEIAARARMDIRTVSTMLGRLKERRVIGVDDSGSKRLYSASERLYCIYYKLRRERGQAGIVRLLLQFMTAFYAPRESAGLLHEFWQEKELVPEIRSLLAQTIAESSQNDEALNRHLRVAKGLFLEALNKKQSGELTAVKGIFDDLIARFSASNDSTLQRMITYALFMKGITLCGKRGNSVAALVVFEDVLTRLSSCEEENLKMVAQALVVKASIHQEMSQYKESKSAYGRALAICTANYPNNPQDMEALALFSKGIVCHRLGETHEAIHCFETLVDRFSSNNNATIRLAIAHALVFVGHVQLEARQVVDAINTSNELEVGFGVLEDAVDIPFGWHAGWMRAKALVLQGRAAAAMGLLRLLVVGTALDNEEMRQKELDNLLELIAHGAPPGDMVQVLSSEPRTADTLHPLVLALRQLAGEEVRAPAEVMEVAADIRRFVERLEAVVKGVAQ